MSNKSILVVEDEADIREGLRELLEVEGYEVFEASNGREALALLPVINRPFLIILDIIMPVMTGQEFYEALQSTPFADIPIIVSTSDASLSPRGLPLIRKPINVSRLLSAVTRSFDRVRPET